MTSNGVHNVEPSNDGVACPFATSGSLETGTSTSGTPFAADAGSCDYYFDSTNGCEAHGMSKYFGGHPAEPQGVVIKDNSTGLWGIGRSTVTATSIISDTVWGNALQEIWCNDDGDPGKAFWVNCMIAAGRDESDYYDALGIVGAGPIGEYTGMLVYQNADGYRYIIAPMLDGQTPQGFQVNGALTVTRNEPSMGLREVAGNDPVNPATDSFSLGNGTPQVWGPQMAAGTAFVEIRRTDAAGIQPTTTDQHQMQVPISQGLTGWTWDQSGNRGAVAGLTNPYWIAVNSFLRCLGLFNADSSTQLAQFLLSSLIVGDGSGTAEIADSSVMPIVGTGTEKQFRFQGVLAQQKPFRDWLTEIVACGLGYYTWEFGKLKLGVRINASAVEAFTGVREGSASCNPARGIAGLHRPQGAGVVFQPGGPSAVVSERDLQTRHVGRAGAQQSGGRVEDSEKMPGGPGSALAGGRGGEPIPGGLRPPPGDWPSQG